MTPRSTREHWTGHTGCIILAPHLTKVTKKSAGLPHFDQATERQRRDGMCWKKEDELYNGGNAFKLTARDETGVIVTIIADNYFGYCKKEVKTQLSYAANLFGLAEEEHAGGALVFQSYDLGEEFSGDMHVKRMGHSFDEMISIFGEIMDVKPEGYAVDKKFPEIIYVPESAHFDLQTQKVSWTNATGDHSIKLSPEKTYVRPSGYKVRMEKPPGAGPAMAAGRHRRRRHVLPQALHGFRRRQIGNFQADHRRDSHRPGVRFGFEERF